MMPTTLPRRFELNGRLSPPGAREVWQARDRRTGRLVVLKGEYGDVQDPAVQATVAEYDRLRRLTHARLARALELHVIPATGGPPTPSRAPAPPFSRGPGDRGSAFVFFTQAFLPGTSLHLRRGCLSALELETCIIEILELVAYLHACGLTRLDLKPQHLIRVDGHWHLIDLGQARAHQPLGQAGLHGTVPYLAPECLLGYPDSPSSDLYSVGAILYEAATGQPPPLQGETLEEIGAWLHSSPVPPLPEALREASPRFAELAQRLLGRQITDRPRSAEEALAMLNQPTRAWRLRSPLPELPLQERTELLDQLQSRLSRPAPSPSPIGQDPLRRALALRGPRGIGRSRLLSELQSRLQAAGRSVIVLTPDRLSDGPLAAIIELENRLQELSGLSLEETAPTSGGIDTALQDTSSWIDARLQGLRKAAQAASAQTASSSAPVPIPVLLDDPERLDALSQQALGRLLPYLEDIGLSLWVSHRTGPAGASPPVPPSGDALSWLEAFPGLELEPLSPEGVRTVAERALSGDVLDADALTCLIEDSTCLPGPLVRLLEHRWRTPDAPYPPRLEDNGSLDMSRMAPDDRELELLSVLAALETPIPASLLEHVLDANADGATAGRELANILGGLERRGLVTRMPGMAGNPERFTVSMTARSGLAARPMDDAQKHRLHAEAADWFERYASPDDPPAAATMAHHLLRCDQPERAFPYLRQAADEAAAGHRVGEAIHWLRHLVAGLSPDMPVRAGFLFQIGCLELQRGNFLLAREVFQQALSSTRLPDRLRRQLLASLGRVQATLRDLPAARKSLEEAVLETTSEPGLAPAGRVAALHRLAWIALAEHQVDEAARVLEAASPAIETAGARLRIDHQYYLCWWMIERGDDAAAVRGRLEATADQARALGYPEGLQNVLNLQVRLEQAADETGRTIELLTEAVGVARRAFDLAREAVACVNLAQLLRAAGREAEAVPGLERAALLAAHLGDRTLQMHALLLLTELLTDVNNRPRARQVLRGVEELTGAFTVDAVTLEWAELLSLSLADPGASSPERLARLDALCSSLHRSGRPRQALMAGVEALDTATRERRLEALPGLLERIAVPAGSSEDRRLLERYHRAAGRAHAVLAGHEPTSEAPGTPTADPRGSIAGKVLEFFNSLIFGAHRERDLAIGLARLVGDLFGGRGLVALYDGPQMRILCSDRIESPEALDIHQGVIENVVRTGRTFTCADMLIDSGLSLVQSLVASKVRSVACVPIRAHGRLVGVLYVDHPAPRGLSGVETQALLERVALMAGGLLQTVVPARSADEFEEDAPVMEGLWGDSMRMKEFRTKVDVSVNYNLDRTILIEGEIGSGKTQLGELIHRWSKRDGDFVVVDCGVITETLGASELFGHVKGAFTGATANRDGAFTLARGGTLLLDEIHNLSLELQAMLLRVVQARKFRPVGAEAESEADVLLIAASNQDLKALVEQGRFRRDLLDRLSYTTLTVPALRERGRDHLAGLARTFLELLPIQLPRPIELENVFTPSALQFLFEYDWPTNIRQFRKALTAPEVQKQMHRGRKVDRSLLEAVALGTEQSRERTPAPILPLPPPGMTWPQLREEISAMCQSYLLREREQNDGNLSLTCKRFGISRSQGYKWERWRRGAGMGESHSSMGVLTDFGE